MQFLSQSRNISQMILTIGMICVVVIAIVASDVFSALFTIIAIRFGYNASLADLTTGRSDIWLDYIEYFITHPGTLLLGKGYTNVLVGGHSTHNTVLQGIYQFGVFGAVIFCAWLKEMLKIMLGHFIIKRNERLSCIILAIATFLPWMAIDLLFFDEFFLMIFYVCLGFKFISESSDGKV